MKTAHTVVVFVREISARCDTLYLLRFPVGMSPVTVAFSVVSPTLTVIPIC